MSTPTKQLTAPGYLRIQKANHTIKGDQMQAATITAHRYRKQNTRVRFSSSMRVEKGPNELSRRGIKEEKIRLATCIRDDGVNHDTSHRRPCTMDHVRWFSHLSLLCTTVHGPWKRYRVILLPSR